MICSLNVPKKFWKKWEILPFRRLPTASDTKWLQAYDIDQPVIFLRSEKPLYLVRHMYENAFLYQSIRSFQLACRARLVKKSATILKQQVESNAVETFANKHLVPCKDTIQSTTKKTLCSRCLLFKRFNFSRKHASSICKARESGDENSRDSQGVFHAGTTQYFSSGALPEINLWSRCKGELFYFCLNCCYQTGSDPGDRASQAWSSLIIEGKWFVLFMVDYAFDVSIFTCILYHYCSLVFYLMTIMDIMK